MRELPESILVWIFQMDMEKYFAYSLFISLMYKQIRHLKSKREKRKFEKEAMMYLDRRN